MSQFTRIIIPFVRGSAASMKSDFRLMNAMNRTSFCVNKSYPASQLQSMRPLSSSLTTMNASSSEVAQDMKKFLVDEIKAEKDNVRQLEDMDDFKAELDGSEVVLTKSYKNEKITIELNVNHTVDSESPDDGTSDVAPEMLSKPNFDVTIVKGGETLFMSCSYSYDDPEDGVENDAAKIEDGHNDIFVIDEVALYSGERKDNVYAVAGEILDGYLYDLLMGMLEERGITQGFANRLSTYCSSYEHKQYIGMLERLQKFVD